MRDAKLVVVQTFNKEWEAELAKSALGSAGIDAMIKAEWAGRSRPHVAFVGGGFKLLVREEDAATAREVLEPPAKPA